MVGDLWIIGVEKGLPYRFIPCLKTEGGRMSYLKARPKTSNNVPDGYELVVPQFVDQVYPGRPYSYIICDSEPCMVRQRHAGPTIIRCVLCRTGPFKPAPPSTKTQDTLSGTHPSTSYFILRLHATYWINTRLGKA